MFFEKQSVLYYILGLVNTIVALSMFKFIAPTLNLTAGNVKKLPIIINLEDNSFIEKNVCANIEIAKLDWDSYETSWDFQRHPLI